MTTDLRAVGRVVVLLVALGAAAVVGGGLIRSLERTVRRELRR